MATAYYTTLDLSPYFVDKDTGAPLAGGYVQFWQDANRTVSKVVFEKQNIGADPVTGQPQYDYVPLPNPLIISGVGTLQNANGDNVAVYYYPFDANGNVQLYYVAVFNYLGVQQFTREGWGFNSSDGGSESGGEIIGDNMISNPQFAKVNFNPSLGLTVTFTGSGTLNIPIAPDWTLQVIYTGNGTIGIARNAIAGSQNYATNPPYILQITPGLNISSLILMQQLPHNPGIWTPQTAGMLGYIASNILLGPSTSVTMVYAPSVGAPTQLLMDNNISTSYVEYSGTVQLVPSANTDNADSGYVNINLELSTSAVSLLSSVQVVGLSTNTTGIAFNQDTVNRQIDHLFNYYKPLLEYKPIPSHLIGWDFPLNPVQANGASVAAQAVGANASYYAWDQTILFQSANSGITVSRDTSGALKTLSAQAGGTQIALVQYLEAAKAIEMLSRRKCVMVSANASVATTATVSLWYTKTSLPSAVVSNQSIVATLDADGYPATKNGTWVQVPRSSLSNNTVTSGATNAAQFTIPVAPSGAANFNQIPLNGWDMQGAVDTQSATFFAIVIGTASLAHNAYILWQSISCQDGDIPTVPGAQSLSQVLADCQRYYEKSFDVSTVPVQNAGVDTGESLFLQVVGSATGSSIGYISYKVSKWSDPQLITSYNPAAANAEIRNESAGSDTTNTTQVANSFNGFSFNYTSAAGSSAAQINGLHWTSDARLGY